MNISIKTHNNLIAIDVESCDSVETLKQKIQDKININPKCQRLYFNTFELDDNKVLSYYDIYDKATIFLTNRLFNEMQIFVRCINKTIVLDVYPYDTIETIKQLITDKEGIPSKIIQLSYGSSILNDSMTLDCYNITNESTLNLYLRMIGN